MKKKYRMRCDIKKHKKKHKKQRFTIMLKQKCNGKNISIKYG